MQKLFTLALVSLISVSCGKKHVHHYYENKFDDTGIVTQIDEMYSKLLLQESRVSVLESKINDKINQEELDTLLEMIADLESQVKEQKMGAVKICNSNEFLIQTQGKFLAVYSTIETISYKYNSGNNNASKEADIVKNVHLGELQEGMFYQTTDGNEVQFEVVAGEIVCK